jgi:2,3,4,5-tetrahydropyridine-2-carboxylate N-succinyltransferase
VLKEATAEGLGAVGHGLATVADDGTVLDTWYPAPTLAGAPGLGGVRSY